MRDSALPAQSVKRVVTTYALVCGVVVVGITGCAVSKQSFCSPADKQSGHTCPQLISTQGVGVIVAQRHVALGWMKEIYLEVPDPKDCRLILFVEKKADIDAVANLLSGGGGDLAHICTIYEKGQLE
jgi:hypothetical protein